MRERRALLLGVPLALVSLLTTAAGCGSSSGSGGGGSGGGNSSLQCSFTTLLEAPVHRQIAATSSVICNFPVVSSTTTLVIQAKKHGAPATAWDNYGDPKTTAVPPPNGLEYTAICVGGLDYQASADITGVGPNNQPFHSYETTDTVTYTQAECNQS
jgi:hypothetical protein